MLPRCKHKWQDLVRDKFHEMPCRLAVGLDHFAAASSEEVCVINTIISIPGLLETSASMPYCLIYPHNTQNKRYCAVIG